MVFGAESANLAFSQGEVYQRLLIKDQQGFHGRMHSVERAAVSRAGASTDCDIASEGIGSYVKLVARWKGISARPWHHQPTKGYDENLRSFKTWAALPRSNQPQIKGWRMYGRLLVVHITAKST